MLGKVLFYDQDWNDDDIIIVHPPSQRKPYWQLKIHYQDKSMFSIETANMIVIRRNDTIVEVHY